MEGHSIGPGDEATAEQSSEYSQAVRALVFSLYEERPIDPTVLHTVQRSLERMLLHKYPAIGEADRADIVSDVITALLVAVRDGRVDQDDNPGAYLRKAADRRAIDHFRHGAKIDLNLDDPDPLPDDDIVVRYLDIDAAAQELEEAFAALAARGEHRASQVVSQWLVLAEKTGEAPSLREAADFASVSHDTVARYLDLFREALLEVREKRQR